MDTYIIKKGDTLESIADEYNIPVIDIIKLNSLKEPYTLKENDILNIPTAPTNIFNYYKVKKGDTIYNLAKEANMSVDTLSQINGLDTNEYIYPDQILLIPKEGVGAYITTTGDTIESVSEYFKTYPQNVVFSNRNIYLLPGQLIVYRRV